MKNESLKRTDRIKVISNGFLAILLVVFFFGNVSLAHSTKLVSAITVRYECNMELEILGSRFNPTADYVELRGSSFGWTQGVQMQRDLANPNIYYHETVQGLNVGENIPEYKFWYSTNNNWEDGSNKTYQVTQQDIANSNIVIHRMFNDLTYTSITVRYECSMEIEILGNRFNPSTDYVELRSSAFGWSQGVQMQRDLANPNIYYHETIQELVSGNNIPEYKYWYSTSSGIYESESWEYVPNRTYQVTEQDFENPNFVIRKMFNDLTYNDVTLFPTEILFTIDTNNGRDADGNLLTASVQTLHITGSNLPLSWSGWNNNTSNEMSPMYDDGTHGDEVAGDKIYSNTFVFHAYSHRHIEYVYVINFVSNTSHISENLEGDNHIINIEQNLLSAKVSNVYGYMGITAAIPFFIDNDKDGIADNIDTQPGAFSNDFSNIAVGGTTTGTIIDRGGRTWKLYKEPNSNGIHIIAGTGTLHATVVGTCSPIVTNEILANTPAEYVLTSGSATLNVITGRIITRIAEGDLRMSAEIGAGNAITFSTEENGIIIATASSSTTNILLTVNGETFTLEAGQTSVCQRTPKGTMRNVLTDITELRGSVTDNKDLNKLDEVIEYVTASINSEFWKDDVHLLTKHGEEVFNKGKDAVNILRNLVKDDKSTITDALLNDFIDRIVASEHELAQIAVKDVTEAGGDMKKISKANEEISKGNSDVSEGKFDSGIEHYRNAWTHALSAVPNLKNADQSLLKFGVAEENIIPTEFKLFGNYPNPFNPTTTIRYSVPEKAVVRLTIYNQLGQRIANLVNEEKEAGYHTVEWNAGNIASGLYFYELNTEKFRSVKKLLLMK